MLSKITSFIINLFRKLFSSGGAKLSGNIACGNVTKRSSYIFGFINIIQASEEDKSKNTVTPLQPHERDAIQNSLDNEI